MKNIIRVIILSLFLLIVACSDNNKKFSDNSYMNYTISRGDSNIKVEGQNLTLSWDIEGTLYSVAHESEAGSELVETDDNFLVFNNLPVESSHSFIIESNSGAKAIIYGYVGEQKIQPSRISAIAYDGEAQLTWQAVPNVVYYDLYTSTDDISYQKIHSTDKTSVIVGDLTNGVTYFFKVVAMFDGANESSTTNMLTYNTRNSIFSVLPGHTFGEMTAVTPNDQSDKHVRVFKGVLKGNEVVFVWDAVYKAERYRIYHADTASGPYILLKDVISNIYTLNLPLEKHYFKIVPVFNDGVGPESQYIRVIYDALPDWTIDRGIESVVISVKNYPVFSEVDLACKDINNDEWFSTSVTKMNFTAGPLEANDYDCKLLLTSFDNIKSESTIKRVTVYRQPDPNEKISVIVWESNAKLRWQKNNVDRYYDVLLAVDDGPIESITTELNNNDFTITGLECGKVYTAYIQAWLNTISLIYKLSSPIEFMLDYEYCYGTLPEDPTLPSGPSGTVENMKSVNNFPRQYFKSEVINNKIYIFGGSINPNVLLQNDLHVYDPANNTWDIKNTATKPSPRDFYASGVINNKLYIFGGRGGSGDTWVFDPSANTWSKLLPSNSPSSRVGIASTVYNNKLYIFGGGYNETWAYDPSTNIWAKLPYGPTKNSYHKTAVTLKNEIYLFGGAIAGRGGSPVNELWKFNPADNSWKKLNPSGNIPARNMHSATVHNNKIYVWAGDIGDFNYSNDFWVYDPSTGTDGTWTKLTPTGLPTPRRGPSIIALGNSIYMINGYNGTTFADTYRFNP